MSAGTLPVPGDTDALNVSPTVTQAAPRPFYGLPYNPADPTVAGSIHLALWIIARKRRDGAK